MAIEVLYHKHDILVVNKPNNQLVHSSYYARNIKEPSLITVLEEQLGIKLYTVHRLDYKTSGVIAFGCTPAAAKHLQDQFEATAIQKNYLALVRGFTAPTGTVDTPVKNADTGVYKPALTNFETLTTVEVPIAVKPYEKSRYSLVRFIPKTGRMHQLRRHANKISHPIIGDHKYGNRHHNAMFAEALNLPDLFLHAHTIRFLQINGAAVMVKAELPHFWQKMAKKFELNLEQALVNTPD